MQSFVWFAEIGAGAIGRLDPGGSVAEFPLPDRSCRPHAVAVDPDGSCRYTAWATHRLGRVAVDGTVGELPLPPGCVEPHGLALAPDGSVWVATENGTLVRDERANVHP